MALKTVVFVDGQNFRHNLRDFHFRSDPPHPSNPEYRLEWTAARATTSWNCLATM